MQIPRIEYYNDKTYSQRRKVINYFKKISVIYENTSNAYYYIKA